MVQEESQNILRCKYKDKAPEETCAYVEKIVDELGLSIKFVNTNDQSLTYSVSAKLCLKDGRELGLSVNGKGMNHLWAKASACGELMERMSNGLLWGPYGYLDKKHQEKFAVLAPYLSELREKGELTPAFQYAPDEVLKSSCDTCVLCGLDSELKSILEKSYQYHVPFWDVNNEQTILIPYGPLLSVCGSNGMCAGNTPHEALVQGINEIIERYVLRRIMFERLALPDISIDFFKDYKICNLIRQAEEKFECRIRIKDCSLGESWPAIGLLFVDYKARKYHFHLGVDISPIIALERCLTESLQGRNEICFKKLDIDIQKRMAIDIHEIKHQMISNCLTGDGHYPHHILDGKECLESPLSTRTLEVKSNHDTLKQICDLIREKGFNIYVRDVSYLNFPAYYVFIPGMSEIVTDNATALARSYDKCDAITYAQNPDDMDVRHFSQWAQLLSLPQWYLHTYRLPFHPSIPLGNPLKIVAALILLRDGRYKKAQEHFRVLLEGEQDAYRRMLYCYAIDWTAIKIDCEEVGTEYLEHAYSREFIEIAEQFLFVSSLNAFSLKMPCFSCKHCERINQCIAPELMKVFKNLKSKYCENMPDQNNLHDLFL